MREHEANRPRTRLAEASTTTTRTYLPTCEVLEAQEVQEAQGAQEAQETEEPSLAPPRVESGGADSEGMQRCSLVRAAATDLNSYTHTPMETGVRANLTATGVAALPG